MDHSGWTVNQYHSEVSQHAGFHRLFVSWKFSTVIRRALNELPKMLDETYERTLLQIEKEIRGIHLQIARYCSYCYSPLHKDELTEVLAVRFDNGRLSFNLDVDIRQ
jgi:hypothetical protein